MASLITTIVTGKDDLTERQIDETLGWKQVELSGVDAIKVMDDPSLSDEKTQA